MIILTSKRLTGLVKVKDQYYVIPVDLIRMARRNFKLKQLIVEPAGRNTAAAIGLAALMLKKKLGDAVMFVLPSDHLIRDKSNFQRCLSFASDLACQGYLVTFGIKPIRPETGYGYIKCGKIIKTSKDLVAFRVEAFKEKPDWATAKDYLKATNYFWNSGIFVWRISTIIEALKSCAPGLYQGLIRYLKTRNPEIFKRLPSISIDYQVMEKAKRIALIKAAFDWDDVGSWDALARYYRKDAKGNVVLGRHIGIDTKDSIVFSEDRLIATIGIQDMIIVDSGSEVLICRKDQLGKIREVVKETQKRRTKSRRNI